MNKTTCPSWEDRRTVDLRGLRVTLSRPILVARSRGFHWFPCIARLGGGDLIATVATTADAYIPQPDAAQYRSRDGGLTWQPLPAMQGQFFSSLSLPGGDRVYLPYHLRPAGDCIQGDSFLLPADGGPPQRRANSVRVVLPRKDRSFAPDLGFAGVVFDGQTLRARDGAYLACMYGRFEDDKRYSTILVESPDAVDWRCRSVIAGPDCPLEGEEGPCETTLCRLADGRLMCVFRLASFKPFGQVFSSDDGRSWSPPAAMEALSVEPSLAVIKGGTVVLSGGRAGIGVWLNAAGDGRQWQPIDIVEHHNACLGPADRIRPDSLNAWRQPQELIAGKLLGFSTGYTELAVVDDCRLLLIYDRIGLGWHPIPDDLEESNSIWLVRVTIEWG